MQHSYMNYYEITANSVNRLRSYADNNFRSAFNKSTGASLTNYALSSPESVRVNATNNVTSDLLSHVLARTHWRTDRISNNRVYDCWR